MVDEQIGSQGRLLGIGNETTDQQRHDLHDLLDFVARDSNDAVEAPVHLQAALQHRHYLAELATRHPAALATAQKAPLLNCQRTADMQVSV